MSLKFLRLPSSPKGEIFGIMFLVWLYVTDVVLDGNTHGMALNMMRIKKYAGEKFMEFYAEKSLFHVGKLTFGPW